MSEFNKKVGKMIPKADAEKAINNWKAKKHKTNSSFFGSDIVNKLLATPGAVGIRIHYGLDADGYMQPCLTAEVDPGTKSAASTQAEEDGNFADSSLGCPPYCPPG